MAMKSTEVAHICMSDWFISSFKPFLQWLLFTFRFYQFNKCEPSEKYESFAVKIFSVT